MGKIPAAEAVGGKVGDALAGPGFEHDAIEAGTGEGMGGDAAGGAGADDADVESFHGSGPCPQERLITGRDGEGLTGIAGEFAEEAHALVAQFLEDTFLGGIKGGGDGGFQQDEEVFVAGAGGEFAGGEAGEQSEGVRLAGEAGEAIAPGALEGGRGAGENEINVALDVSGGRAATARGGGDQDGGVAAERGGFGRCKKPEGVGVEGSRRGLVLVGLVRGAGPRGESQLKGIAAGEGHDDTLA